MRVRVSGFCVRRDQLVQQSSIGPRDVRVFRKEKALDRGCVYTCAWAGKRRVEDVAKQCTKREQQTSANYPELGVLDERIATGDGDRQAFTAEQAIELAA